MKITIKQNELMQMLERVRRSAGSPVLPVCNNLKLGVEAGKLTITGTNLETETQMVVDVDGSDEGTILVPLKFVDIVKSFEKDQTIEIYAEEMKVRLSAGQNKFTLNGMDPDEFPVNDPGELKAEFGLDGLARLAAQTVFATSKQKFDQEFKLGVMFQTANNVLTCLATDSYRLVRLNRAVETDEELQFLVPTKALKLAAATTFKDGPVTCTVTTNSVTFADEDCRMCARLLVARYPNLQQVFPETSKTTVQNNGALETVVARASLVAQLIFTLTLNEDGLIEITAESEGGTMSGQVQADHEGEPLELSRWNVSYFLEGLAAVGAGTIEFNGPLGACVMRGDGLEYLVLPVKKEER